MAAQRHDLPPPPCRPRPRPPAPPPPSPPSYLRRRYDDLVRQVPLMAVHNAGRSAVPADIYTPPPLRSGGHGWHPEWCAGMGGPEGWAARASLCVAARCVAGR